MLNNKERQSTPKLEQTEREAIVDLLHLCLYADSHIGTSESAVLTIAVETMGWDEKHDFSIYEQRSIPAARLARKDEFELPKFLENVARRIKTSGARELAMSLSADLFSADGTVPKEIELFKKISNALRP